LCIASTLSHNVAKSAEVLRVLWVERVNAQGRPIAETRIKTHLLRVLRVLRVNKKVEEK
jgi:hypothetical protein